MFPFNWHTIVPVEWTLQSYRDIFGISEEGAKGGLRFQRGLLNSGVITKIGTNTCIAEIVWVTMTNSVTGFSSGSVMCQNR